MPVYGWDASNFTAIQRGDTHHFTRFRGAAGVSLHPFQRTGQVPAFSHDMTGRQAAMGHPGLGDGPPAGSHDMTLPPVVPIAGTPRDERFMI